MDNDEQKKYDIEKLAESNNRERKINNDFDDDDFFGGFSCYGGLHIHNMLWLW